MALLASHLPLSASAATSQKVGGYNYNWAPGQRAELGFGRINVYLALAL